MIYRLTVILISLFISYAAHAQPIPVTVIKDTTKVIELNGQRFFEFTPKAGQTIYSISRAYGISQDELLNANAGLKENGLKTGVKIKIPANGKVANTTPKTTTPTSSTPPVTGKAPSTSLFPSVIVSDSIKRIYQTDCNKNNQKKNEYTVGVFLPFGADTAKVDINATVALEFYQGVLFAAEDFKNNDTKITLRIFDNNNYTPADLKQLDLAIGPLFATEFQKVSAQLDTFNIACVSPFSQTYKVIQDNTDAHKITPSAITIIDQCAGYIAKNYSNQNIIFLTSTLAKDIGTMSMYRDRLKAAIETPGGILKEYNYSKSGKIPDNLFVAGKENMVVFPSTDPTTVTLLVSQLSELASKYNIQLWGLSQWQNYDDLDLQKLSKLNLHFARTGYYDITKKATAELNKRYRIKCHTDAGEYFYQGYDITLYYLTMLAKYGRNLSSCLLAEGIYHGVQTNIQFGKNDAAKGIENIAISILKYNGNKVVEANP